MLLQTREVPGLLLLLLLLLVVRVEGRVVVAVVQQRHSVGTRGRRGVHALHRGVHLVDQLLQVHVIFCRQGRRADW